MKKILFISIISAVVCLSSCKKSSNDEEKPDNPFNLEYSNLTTEQHKKALEQAGVDFVKEFNSLPDEKSIDVLSYFSGLGLSFNEEVASVSNVLAISSHASKKNVAGVLAAINDDDVSKLSEFYGIYTWNASKDEWDESSSSDKLEFRFPSEEGKSSNNATLTISYIKDKIYTIDGESVELPKSSVAVLKVDNVEELKFISTHEYKADGTPTKADISLTIGAFVFTSNTSNSGNNVSSGFALKKGTKQLLAANVSGESTVTVTNLNNEDDVENLLNNANAEFAVMNYKFIGQANMKEIIKEVNNISYDDSEAGKKEAAVWNKHALFAAVNTTDNTLVAKIEFEGTDDEDCYDYPNGNGGVSTYCYNYSSVEPLLVFKDGSKQSIENFVDNGFSKVIEELENLIEEFE